MQRDRRPGSEVRLVDGEPVDQHVGVAAAQSGVRIAGIDLVQDDLAVRVPGLEFLDETAERGPVGGGGEAEAQRAADAGGDVSGVG